MEKKEVKRTPPLSEARKEERRKKVPVVKRDKPKTANSDTKIHVVVWDPCALYF